uniref:Uncharacterized protein n=1 Tax=Lactiplantibacillus plantarum TaxID=1590 RepID=A0A6C0VXX9_LACPN|nr:hypothetical protein [Lactiplantibacillus plantarum]
MRSISRTWKTTCTAPCKTYLAFGGINKRLENMRPNTRKNSKIKGSFQISSKIVSQPF